MTRETILLPRMSAFEVDQILEALRAGSLSFEHFEDLSALPDHATFAAVGGRRMGVGELTALRDLVRSSADAAGYPGTGSADAKARFDALCGAALASSPLLSSGDAQRDDTWAFVAAWLLRPITYWRYSLSPDRYHGGVRNTFQRLWMRARALDRGPEAADRWALLEALSEDALVAITERPAIGGVPPLARAVGEGWLRASERYGRSRMEPIMRQAAITVRLRNEITALAQLEAEDLSRIIDEAFERAARHISTPAPAPSPAASTKPGEVAGAGTLREAPSLFEPQVNLIGGPLPAYVVSEYMAAERTSVAPHNAPLQRLAQIAVEIVRVEQPIHAEEVGRRLAAAFGLQMAGSRIQEAALRGLRAAGRSGILNERDGFWRVVDAAPQPARDRSQLPPSIGVRRSNLICAEEYAAAARNVLLDRLALSRTELIVEAARQLGFARTGSELEKAIGSAIDAQLAEELEDRGDGRLGLRGIDGSEPRS